MNDGGTPAIRTIAVEALARVEGEGALDIRIRGRTVEEVKLRIFEPPRLFEALLQGRQYSDAPDITARICGICPIAYLLGASQAMEAALGIEVSQPIRELRRLIYCGEWIASHILHIAMLHLPDYLGLPDALTLARTDAAVVETALKLKQIGNQILETVGGRAVHPVNLKVGGFYRSPAKSEIHALIEPLEWALDATHGLLRFLGRLEIPDFDDDYVLVAIVHPTEYAMAEGRIVSSLGHDLEIRRFERHFGEEQVAHSMALQGVLRDDERPYLTGPIARYNLSFDRLSPTAQAAAREVGLPRTCRNPFQSILVRAVETLYALEEALRLARAYEVPEAPSMPVKVRAGEGSGATEAPRGICYHHYAVDGDGRIVTARIIPPTSQNQRRIEHDLRRLVERHLDLPDVELQQRCEQAIRNYDPCISCATHFLSLKVERQ